MPKPLPPVPPPGPNQPLGVFDSGIGGLTVVRALRKVLPHEDIVYLGDTARVPYGTKSPATVTRFALEDAAFLRRQEVKAIVVACNTASAWALPALRHTLNIPLFGVIIPGVEAALAATRSGRIGIIATASTIQSKAYERGVHERSDTALTCSQSCPLLVPLVEEGWTDHSVTRSVLRTYLAPLLRARIDTLVLGCTHYPLLEAAIQKQVTRRVVLVDSAAACATFVRDRLAHQGLLARPRRRRGALHPFVTDEPDRFNALARRFLNAPCEPAWRVDLSP